MHRLGFTEPLATTEIKNQTLILLERAKGFEPSTPTLARSFQLTPADLTCRTVTLLTLSSIAVYLNFLRDSMRHAWPRSVAFSCNQCATSLECAKSDAQRFGDANACLASQPTGY